MSKYKVGDEFVVEIKEVLESSKGTLYRSEFSTLTFDDYVLDKLQKVEGEQIPYNEAYNKGLEDVWKLVNKIHEMGYGNVIEVFPEINGLIGCEIVNIVEKYTPQEALAKLEAYEKEQTEIKVGDVVECINDDTKAVVMDNGSQTFLWQVFTENGCIELWKECEFVKTGKHIDIQSVLQQIGGAE